MKPTPSHLTKVLPKMLVLGLLCLILYQQMSLSQSIGDIHQELLFTSNRNDVSRVLDDIKETLNQDHWVVYDHWQIRKINDDDSTITLQYEWSLSETTDEAEISLQVQPLLKDQKPAGDWKKLPATSIGINSYRAFIEVTALQDYRIQIVSEGNYQHSSQTISIPSYLHQPPDLVPAFTSISHQNKPDFKEGDVEIGFSMFYQKDYYNDPYSPREPHPSLNFIPEKAKAYFHIDGQVIEKDLSLEEKEKSNMPPGEFPDYYSKVWALSFPAFSSDSLEKLRIEITYKNGFFVSKDYTDFLYNHFPDLSK
ncbi:hypothetical protein [Tindallia californiensis]|uniref:Uncharacterized protein n=1 Tax=Tindallia californiensis TaxID=159292 RepID=A0A1H3PU34_9FIRM|nr:hypothetical protein [Tindallia californiensis]SDZ04355.1 hypothetical protein SAMN05192546_10783 [Tindallia californiensis]